jgi:hypothetical protein
LRKAGAIITITMRTVAMINPGLMGRVRKTVGSPFELIR